MTIAELFIKLGFKFDGREDLDKSVEQLQGAATQSLKAAAGIDLVAGALVALVGTAVNAAIGMQKFALQTGLSNTQLQQWEHTARLGNVSAQELQTAVKGLQAAGASIALGQGNTSPWILLGINPHADPFEMLKQLHTALQNISPERLAMARVIATQAGISENMFQLLRQKNLPIDSLKQMYLLTAQNQAELIKLNRQWENLLDSTERLKNKFASDLGLDRLVGWLQKAVDILGEFVEWLERGSKGANVVKASIQILAIALIAGAAAITSITTALGLLTSGLIAFQLAAAIPLGTIAAIAAAALLAADAIAILTTKYGPLTDAQKKAREDLRAAGGLPAGNPGYRHTRTAWEDFAGTPSTPAAGDQNSQVTQHVKIDINGAGDPASVAKAVVDSLTKQLNIATYTKPATAR